MARIVAERDEETKQTYYMIEGDGSAEAETILLKQLELLNYLKSRISLKNEAEAIKIEQEVKAMSKDEIDKHIACNYRVRRIEDEQYKFSIEYEDDSLPIILVEAVFDKVDKKVRWKKMPLALCFTLETFNYIDL